MPVKKSPLAEAPRPRALSELRVSEYGIEPAKAEPAKKIVKPEEYVAELGKRWTETVLTLSEPMAWEGFLRLSAQMDEVVLLSLGFKRTMVDLGESYNHQMLIGAADSILMYKGLLVELLPLSIRDLNLEELASDVRTLKFFRAFLMTKENTSEMASMLVSHLQKSVDQRVRGVAATVVPAMQTTRELRDPFRPLQQLVSQPAEEAVSTKKQIAKAVEKVQAKVDAAGNPVGQAKPDKGEDPEGEGETGKDLGKEPDPAKRVLRKKNRG